MRSVHQAIKETACAKTHVLSEGAKDFGDSHERQERPAPPASPPWAGEWHC